MFQLKRRILHCFGGVLRPMMPLHGGILGFDTANVYRFHDFLRNPSASRVDLQRNATSSKLSLHQVGIRRLQPEIVPGYSSLDFETFSSIKVNGRFVSKLNV